MKEKLIAFSLFLTVAASAQTNAIIFPQLLSPSGTVLMTNAEFRVIYGNKIWFLNDVGYKSFNADDLNTNVLNALGTSADELDSKKAAADAAHQKYLTSAAIIQAEQERQRQLALVSAAKTQAAYRQPVQPEKELHGQSFYYTTRRQSVGIGAP